jgi:hypothetical protein
MGCASSTKIAYLGRLTVVDQSCADEKGKTGADGLDVMQTCAKELKEVMDIIINAGAKDTESMVQVEQLSNLVLFNLESRICPALFEDGSEEIVLEKIMLAAKDLDTVRAVKASTRLEARIDPLKKHMAAKDKKESEGEAKKLIDDVGAKLQAIAEPDHVVPGIEDTVATMEKAYETSPTSRKVADVLLKQCMALAQKVRAMIMKMLAADPGCADGVIAALAKLDDLGEKLAAVPEPTTWDPLVPKMVSMVAAQAGSIANKGLQFAEKALAADQGAQAFAALKKVQPWWQHAKDIEGNPARLELIIEKAEKSLLDAFKGGLDTANEDMCAGVMEFAGTFREIRTSFGYEPRPEGERLVDRMKAMAGTAGAGKPLGELEVEVAKADGQDLSVMLRSMQAFVGALPKVDDGAERNDLTARGDKACQAVGDWTLAAAAACGADKLEDLEKFAVEYDKAHMQACPPLAEREKGELCPRIRPYACNAFFEKAEEELGKETGLNPAVILEALKQIGERVPPGTCRFDDVTTERLNAIAQKTDGRIMESAEKASAAGESGKIQGLCKYSESFDEALVSCGGDALGLSDKVRELEGKAVEGVKA